MINRHEYLDMISHVARTQSQLLEATKVELEALGIHDINNIQALTLFNIGSAEMTVGELTLRGCYHGTNASYILKKMVENGYLLYERSVHDLRSIRIRLTEKGVKLRDLMLAMHQRHLELLANAAVTDEALQSAIKTLSRLERTWIQAGDLLRRPGQIAA